MQTLSQNQKYHKFIILAKDITVFKNKPGAQEKINEQLETGDKSELSEIRSRMKILMNKLQISKKEKDQLQKENQNLQQEIISMQTNLRLRSMVTGFANTSSTFPMVNEVLNQIAEFYKCECFDIFFDVLCPELSIKGIIFFFQTSVDRVKRTIDEYFQPVFGIIKQTGQLESIEGPILNVLRKSFQTTYKQIETKILPGLPYIREEIQKHLKLEDSRNLIAPFLEKLLQLLLCCFLSDPPIVLDVLTIGTVIQFNQSRHDPIDGFIKSKEECIVVMPAFFKGDDQIGKALVVSSSYEIN